MSKVVVILSACVFLAASATDSHARDQIRADVQREIQEDVSTDYVIVFSNGDRERRRVVYMPAASLYMIETGIPNNRRCHFRFGRWVERRIDEVGHGGRTTKGTPIEVYRMPPDVWYSPRKSAVEYQNCSDVVSNEWVQKGDDARAQARSLTSKVMQEDQGALMK